MTVGLTGNYNIQGSVCLFLGKFHIFHTCPHYYTGCAVTRPLFVLRSTIGYLSNTWSSLLSGSSVILLKQSQWAIVPCQLRPISTVTTSANNAWIPASTIVWNDSTVQGFLWRLMATNSSRSPEPVTWNSRSFSREARPWLMTLYWWTLG